MPKYVFVIMPFDAEFKDVYTEIIAPPFIKLGFNVSRADDSTIGQHSIYKDIIDGIVNADLVVAEMTTANANVLYELGIAHALNKPTVMLVQNFEDIPFDLRTYRILTYSFDFRKVADLTLHLEKIAEEVNAGKFTFSNPVKDYAANVRVEITPTSSTNRSPSQLTLPVSSIPTDEKGLWDFALESETSITELTNAINRISDMTINLSGGLNAASTQILAIQNTKQSGKASKINGIIQRVSVELTDFATSILEEAVLIENEWEVATKAIVGMFGLAEIITENDLNAALALKMALENTKSQLALGLGGLKAMRNSLSHITGISRELGFAAQKTGTALDRLIEEFLRIDADGQKLIEMINNHANNYIM